MIKYGRPVDPKKIAHVITRHGDRLALHLNEPGQAKLAERLTSEPYNASDPYAREIGGEA